LNIRDSASLDWSLRRGSFQSRIAARIALPAWSATAGLKVMQYVPHRFFDRRGRNVYPRTAHFSFGYGPRRSSSLPYTIFVVSG
jgi:hypothetical protein